MQYPLDVSLIPTDALLRAQLRLRVVRRVDVEDVERHFEIDLHDGRTGGPGEVVHLRRQGHEAAGLEHLTRVTVQRVAHAHVQRAGQNVYAFRHAVPVRRDGVVRRELESQGDRTLLRWIAFEDADL